MKPHRLSVKTWPTKVLLHLLFFLVLVQKHLFLVWPLLSPVKQAYIFESILSYQKASFFLSHLLCSEILCPCVFFYWPIHNGGQCQWTRNRKCNNQRIGCSLAMGRRDGQWALDDGSHPISTLCFQTLESATGFTYDAWRSLCYQWTPFSCKRCSPFCFPLPCIATMTGPFNHVLLDLLWTTTATRPWSKNIWVGGWLIRVTPLH